MFSTPWFYWPIYIDMPHLLLYFALRELEALVEGNASLARQPHSLKGLSTQRLLPASWLWGSRFLSSTPPGAGRGLWAFANRNPAAGQIIDASCVKALSHSLAADFTSRGQPQQWSHNPPSVKAEQQTIVMSKNGAPLEAKQPQNLTKYLGMPNPANLTLTPIRFSKTLHNPFLPNPSFKSLPGKLSWQPQKAETPTPAPHSWTERKTDARQRNNSRLWKYFGYSPFG